MSHDTEALLARADRLVRWPNAPVGTAEYLDAIADLARAVRLLSAGGDHLAAELDEARSIGLDLMAERDEARATVAQLADEVRTEVAGAAATDTAWGVRWQEQYARAERAEQRMADPLAEGTIDDYYVDGGRTHVRISVDGDQVDELDAALADAPVDARFVVLAADPNRGCPPMTDRTNSQQDTGVPIDCPTCEEAIGPVWPNPNDGRLPVVVHLDDGRHEFRWPSTGGVSTS